MLQRDVLYPAPPGSPPYIPGIDFAGEVVALGRDVERFSVGDRVMALVGGGGQAELALAHERVTTPAPDTLKWPAAGGFPEVFTTAHDALFSQCALRMGEHTLVHAAAGGVGIAGGPLAALAGGRVYTSKGPPDHRVPAAAAWDSRSPTPSGWPGTSVGRGSLAVR